MPSGRKVAIILGTVALVLIILAIIFRKQIRKAMSKAVDILLKPQQEAFIKDLHPDVQARFRALIKDIEDTTGYGVYVTTGYRTFAKQKQLDDANDKNAEPGTSLHNYGMALDLNLFKGSTWLKKKSPKQSWINTGAVEIIKRHGFRWGGDFKTYYDPIHIDLGNDYNASQLFAQAKIQFGNDPYKIQGNQVTLI